jgi:aminoglycoside phosphotransferase (APT) family kinase protein
VTDVQAVLQQVVPDRRIAATTPVHRGNHKQTVVVTFANHDSLVVQLSSDPDALRTEHTLASAIRERTSLPVPPVVAAGELDGTGYVVVEHVAGVDLHTRFTELQPSERRTVTRLFGRYLAELHDAFQFDGYGAVRAVFDADGDDAVSTTADLRTHETADWPTWFEAYAREGIEALPPAFESLRAPLSDAIADSDVPPAPPARLFPWDLRPGNALVDDGELSAVLDWGDPLAAAPGLAVAKTEHLVADWYVSDGSPLREAFRAGYRSVRPLPSVPTVYRLVAVVRSAVDSQGVVTRPGYPERDGDEAVAFHADRLRALLTSLSSEN